MAYINIDDLKKQFKNLNTPYGKEFLNLIDSTHNYTLCGDGYNYIQSLTALEHIYSDNIIISSPSGFKFKINITDNGSLTGIRIY